MKTGRMWKMQKGEDEDWKNVEKCRRGKRKDESGKRMD